MDFHDVTKIVGAILATLLGMLLINVIANSIFRSEIPSRHDAAAIAPAPAASSSPAPAASPALSAQPGAVMPEAATPGSDRPFAALLAEASIDKGASEAKKCVACHTFEKGAPNRIGPNLYAIVGRDRGTRAGFNYTSAMKGKGGKWTYNDLDRFLMNPKMVIPGTNMSFPGIAKASDRANMLVYLRSLADDLEPLPAFK
jgi:cytochrome c